MHQNALSKKFDFSFRKINYVFKLGLFFSNFFRFLENFSNRKNHFINIILFSKIFFFVIPITNNLPQQMVEFIKNKNYWWREYKKKSSLEAIDKIEILKKIIKDEIIKFKSTQCQRFLDKLGKNQLFTMSFGAD